MKKFNSIIQQTNNLVVKMDKSIKLQNFIKNNNKLKLNCNFLVTSLDDEIMTILVDNALARISALSNISAMIQTINQSNLNIKIKQIKIKVSPNL